MAWNQQGGGGGGGPWGSGGGTGGGRGGSNDPWGNGRGPRRSGGGQTPPPEIDELIRQASERFRKMVPGGFGGGMIALLVLVGVVIWGLTGIYTVGQAERGVVLRFGKHVRDEPPGLHYHLPYPIETVILPMVTRENRIEFGLETFPNGQTRLDTAASLMLTGDENIIDIQFSVVWVIKDPAAYLFNVRNPDETVRWAAESAMREVVGQMPLQRALTDGRGDIEARTRTILQGLMDEYGSGIEIRRLQVQKNAPPSEVGDAFSQVQRARQQRDQKRLEAETRRNQIIPVARGERAAMIEAAEAYKESVVLNATGDAERFSAIHGAYKGNPGVTRSRIYIETMEQVFKNANKLVTDSNGSGVVPYLALPELQRGRTIAPTTGAGAQR